MEHIPEYDQILVECSLCTTFTIARELAAAFRAPQNLKELHLLRLLSLYLRQAGDDDNREVTDVSWRILAAETEGEMDE